jgi:hypothetical protein
MLQPFLVTIFLSGGVESSECQSGEEEGWHFKHLFQSVVKCFVWHFAVYSGFPRLKSYGVNVDELAKSQKSPHPIIPAKAGIQ